VSRTELTRELPNGMKTVPLAARQNLAGCGTKGAEQDAPREGELAAANVV